MFILIWDLNKMTIDSIKYKVVIFKLIVIIETVEKWVEKLTELGAYPPGNNVRDGWGSLLSGPRVYVNLSDG